MKETLQKYIHFIGLGLIVLTIGLLFIPGSFVAYGNVSFGGMESIFSANKYFTDNFSNGNVNGGAIAALVMLVLAAPCLLLNKKSSALLLLAGILEALAAIMFLSMQLWVIIAYPKVLTVIYMSYILGALQLIVAAATIYVSVLRLKEEKNHVGSAKQSYSYLKNK